VVKLELSLKRLEQVMLMQNKLMCGLSLIAEQTAWSNKVGFWYDNTHHPEDEKVS
jgi:hypothetical protein